jgi:hypothetical protein
MIFQGCSMSVSRHLPMRGACAATRQGSSPDPAETRLARDESRHDHSRQNFPPDLRCRRTTSFNIRLAWMVSGPQ